MAGVTRRLDASLLLVAKAQGRFCVRVSWEKRQPFKSHQVHRWDIWRKK